MTLQNDTVALTVNDAPSADAGNSTALSARRRQREQQHYNRYVDALREKVPGCLDCSRDDVAGLTIFLARDVADLGKSFAYNAASGSWQPASTRANSSLGYVYPVRFSTLEEIAAALHVISTERGMAIVRAAVHKDADLIRLHRRRWHASERHDGEEGGVLVDVPRRILLVDIDGWILGDGVSYDDLPTLAAWIARQMPAPFTGASFAMQLSSSAGLKDPHILKIHSFYFASEPIGCRAYHKILQYIARSSGSAPVDAAVGNGAQLLFTAAPTLIGGADPFEGRTRTYVHRGDRETVDLTLLVSEVHRERERRRTVPPFTTRGTIRPYVGAWVSVAKNQMGYRTPPLTRGYQGPIYSLITIAVRSGETDFEAMKSRLRELVWIAANEHGDLPSKRGDIERYLRDSELDRRINDAVAYRDSLEGEEDVR